MLLIVGTYWASGTAGFLLENHVTYDFESRNITYFFPFLCNRRLTHGAIVGPYRCAW